ncbi:uncharacterized protein LOC100573637 [Acyrthosiphon pisum]|uniref:Uncharacterized protein n=1 Tax=Acyrthosiphon pisum TaxID=7029 RepID=A0A8R1W9E1_ACYPI|nr:uncharacterized protein LOC100573637 [Acyrthosiphon pisum]|eukprot:XP_003245794.1 PREDICTED: uncharacterized protein LOC100573637 [Acyrthosiphon pisum]
MESRGALLLLVVYVAAFQRPAHGQDCPDGVPVTYVKYSNSAPRSVVQPILLYASTPGVAITAECYNRCRKSVDCAGFIIDYTSTSCYRVPNMGSSTDNIVVTPNVNFFRKACLRVPESCNRRAWPIEVSMDYEISGFQYSVVPNVGDKWRCAQLCIDQNDCKSANYFRLTKMCSLNSETRKTKPTAFNPSRSQVEYLENECANTLPGVNQISSCWHEPVYDRTLQQVDLQVENINIEQCKERCESEQYFSCRGYTFKCPTDEFGGTLCLLHGDDTSTAGPLIPSPCSTYIERITCIDLSVSCSDDSMIVSLRSQGFKGRMFVLGRPEECGVNGRHTDMTTITLPIVESNTQRNRCDVLVAKSGNSNRKLATAVVVVQHHPIIQTVGDRVTKVSCAIGSSPLPSFLASRPQNITLDATFGVAEPSIHNTIYNDGGYDPNGLVGSANQVAKMRILEVGRNVKQVSEVKLGDELELRIDVNQPYNATQLRAGHLIASSGDGLDSLLLLDWRGCPPEPSTFPVLNLTPPNSMVARFKAFRFPSSPVLRFSLMMMFCDQLCKPSDCGNGQVSHGRRKRDVHTSETKTKEVPLQLAIVVRSLEEQEEIIASQSQISNSNNNNDRSSRRLEASVIRNNEWCITWPIGLAIGIILVTMQTLLVLGCWSFFRRSNQKVLNDRVTLNSDFQPRHVTWADHQ